MHAWVLSVACPINNNYTRGTPDFGAIHVADVYVKKDNRRVAGNQRAANVLGPLEWGEGRVASELLTDVMGFTVASGKLHIVSRTICKFDAAIESIIARHNGDFSGFTVPRWLLVRGDVLELICARNF